MSQTAMEKHNSKVDEESGQGQVSTYIDAGAEKSCVRKLDFILLPFLSLVSVLIYRYGSANTLQMYFFNSVDRVGHSPRKIGLLLTQHRVTSRMPRQTASMLT